MCVQEASRDSGSGWSDATGNSGWLYASSWAACKWRRGKPCGPITRGLVCVSVRTLNETKRGAMAHKGRTEGPGIRLQGRAMQDGHKADATVQAAKLWSRGVGRWLDR